MALIRKLTPSLVLVALVAAPAGVVATLLLAPLWRWIEATTGFESIGHSGPAGWCYVVTVSFAIFAGCMVLFSSTK